MELRKAGAEEFESVRGFYWRVIDLMNGKGIGWKKGIYPADEFLSESLEKGELYVIDNPEGGYAASVIVNSLTNEGYAGIKWRLDCKDSEVLIPHALAVLPTLHGQGIGKTVVDDIFELARQTGKKVVRLDVLSGNPAAEHLYTGKGFRFVESRTMFYEDTGWAEFHMFEYIL